MSKASFLWRCLGGAFDARRMRDHRKQGKSGRDLVRRGLLDESRPAGECVKLVEKRRQHWGNAREAGQDDGLKPHQFLPKQGETLDGAAVDLVLHPRDIAVDANARAHEDRIDDDEKSNRYDHREHYFFSRGLRPNSVIAASAVLMA